MSDTVSLAYITAVHDDLVDNGYCMGGIRDDNLLHSAVDGQYWYEKGIEQIIHVAYSICANHIFSDGNKRTTFLTLKLLEIDLGYICDWAAIANTILDLATNSISKIDFHDKIYQSIFFVD